MKNVTVVSLAVVAVITMIYAGINALTNDYAYGPFITFIGACSAVGLVIDIYNMIQIRIKKSNVRKLGRY
jgi:hypothetical protein